MESLEKLLGELNGRNVSGPAGAKLFAVQQGLWTMINRPEDGFLCGPSALASIREARGDQVILPETLRDAHSHYQRDLAGTAQTMVR